MARRSRQQKVWDTLRGQKSLVLPATRKGLWGDAVRRVNREHQQLRDIRRANEGIDPHCRFTGIGPLETWMRQLVQALDVDFTNRMHENILPEGCK